MNSIIIALDIGSSSIRCSPYLICTNPRTVKALSNCASVRKISSVKPNSGKIILCHHAHSTTLNKDDGEKGTVSSQQNETLFDEIDKSIDESLSKLRSEYKHHKFQIVGLGISSFVMNLIGIDDKGELILSNSNNCDSNTGDACERGGGGEHTLSYACNSQDVVNECMALKKELGEEELHDMYQRTGTPLHSAYALAQLRVHHQKYKANFVHQWTTIASYCILRWTGQWRKFQQIPISYSEASWTGLFNFRTCKWDDKCCKLLPKEYQDALPLVNDYKVKSYQIEEYIDKNDGNSWRRVRNQYWDRWPELCCRNGGSNQEPCRLYLGFGDGVCANVGSKCTSTNRIACTIGTSAAIRRIIPVEKQIGSDLYVPYGLFCYRIDSRHILLGGALTDGGSIVEFLRKLLNLKSENDFLSCLADANDQYTNCIDGSGETHSENKLCVVPFLSGERSVGFRGGATGCVSGLTRESKPSDLMQSSLESVILRLKQILELIERTGAKSFEKAACVVASGNALEKNTLWRQMLSDCTAKKVVKDKEAHEGTSRGVSVLISQHLGQSGQEGDDHEYLHEELIFDEEQNPSATSQTYWKARIEQQESIIKCMSTQWK